MDRPSAAAVRPSSTVSPDTRLQGPQLFVTRVVWLLLFALNLIWLGLGIAPQVATTLHPCGAAACTLTPAQATLVQHLGIGLSTVAAFHIGMPVLIVITSFILAVLLFWRRSDDWMALGVGLFLCWTVSTFILGPSDTGVAGSQTLTIALALADNVIFYAVLLLFPDGRFVPRWAWLLLAAWAIHEVGEVPINEITFTGGTPTWFIVFSLIFGIAYPILYLSALGIQVYRFRRVSNARQRQQTKLVVLGFAVALIANILYWIVLPLALPLFLTPQSLHAVTVLYPVVGYPLFELALTALPLSLVIAIQRNQLFDVDILIRRTLVYGALTAVLAAVYFGAVVGMQTAVGAADRQASGSPVIVVASTLLIAALFTPLRRTLQAGIDRRFYRRKYDAARTLEAFAATLRTETDLEALRGELLAVVRETMQPEHVSLWLRPRGALMAGGARFQERAADEGGEP